MVWAFRYNTKTGDSHIVRASVKMYKDYHPIFSYISIKIIRLLKLCNLMSSNIDLCKTNVNFDEFVYFQV